ncbi:MAG: RecQ family ATP-dependent DNA helicase, partial [Tenacibaculum sp.]
MTYKALQILKTYWGYNSFREPQSEIINSVLSGSDTIALLPTAAGKSICYQVPAMLKNGICIVVSPLLALIQDQLENLKARGIKAMTIPSGSNSDEIIRLFDNLRFDNYKFLYLSPERLQSKFIQEKLKHLTVNLLAIDEAHCISEWGHDFRPSYLKLLVLKQIHPQIPILALTATATKKVIQSIASILELRHPKVFKTSFLRKNLTYRIVYTEDKIEKLMQIIDKTKAPTIVYVDTRKKTKELSKFLNVCGFKSGFYHGGLTAVEKKIAFDNWMSEKTLIIVATNAFGMGIDKPNVRLVVHLYIPGSIENFTQEAGRAGRDGKEAFSIVISHSSEAQVLIERQKKQLPTIGEIKNI